MTDTTEQEFNFDAFMYSVRRDSPFDGITLADSISDDEVRRAESAFNSLLKHAEKAEAELAELKGDQVPVITCYSCRKVMTRDQHAEADGFCPHCDVEIEPDEDELFTAPQKPVVSLNSSTVMSRAYVVKQIEAAGGSVKEGE